VANRNELSKESESLLTAHWFE